MFDRFWSCIYCFSGSDLPTSGITNLGNFILSDAVHAGSGQSVYNPRNSKHSNHRPPPTTAEGKKVAADAVSCCSHVSSGICLRHRCEFSDH